MQTSMYLWQICLGCFLKCQCFSYSHRPVGSFASLHKHFLHLFSSTFEVDTLVKGMRVIYIYIKKEKNHNFLTLSICFNMLIYHKLRLT